MQAESECDEWRTFAGDTIVCRAIAPRTVEQLSIWIEIQNNMQDILLPSNSIKCIHCLQNNCTQYHVKKNCAQEIMTQCNVAHRFTIAHRKTATIANYNALYPSPADQLRCTDNQCFMMNYSTGVSAQQSVIIVLQTPTPIVYEVGGGLLCGWKGSSKDKGVQKKLSNLSKLPNFVKVQNTIRVDFQ